MQLKIPPLLLTALFAALAWALAAVTPELTMTIPGREVVSHALAICGAIICGAAIVSFRRARTTVNPTRPEQASSIVTTGVYAISRNPMYLGFLGLLVGWAIYLANAIVLILVPIGFVAYLNRFQIRPEEEALKSRFGAGFVAYAGRVRRWL